MVVYNLDEIGLSAAKINVVLDALASLIEPVHLHFVWRPRLKDPADEMVLDTAVNGHADRLATFNLRHLRLATMEFGIRADRPGAILREIRGTRT
jgi:predicted nucleic acid-binding protein